jgi:hypothetical protein
MKVCSQCEFIYEDDQSVCDMDGAELVYDPAPLALTQAASSETATPLAHSRWKRLGATAIAGIVLGTVLVLLFQVFTLRTQEQLSRTGPQNPNSSSAQPGDSSGSPNLDLALPVPLVPPVDALPAPVPSTSPQSMLLPEGSPQAIADVLARPGANAPAPRLAAATRKRDRANPKPLQASSKESKVGSFLKKTGRILKKPFKF